MDDFPNGYADPYPVRTDDLGATYLARDLESNSDVAVLVLDVCVPGRPERRRFRNACGADASLESIPGVLAFQQIGFTQTSRPYLVADPPDATLADHIASHGAVHPIKAITIGAALARTLAAAHDVGVIHLDVRPENVVSMRARPLLLARFGLARAAVAAGMPEMPPASLVHASREVFGWETPGPASDVHGLASTIHTMLAGQPPYAAEAASGYPFLYQRILRGHPAQITEPSLPHSFTSMLSAMMDPAPAARPRLDEVCKQLDELAGDVTTVSLPGNGAPKGRTASAATALVPRRASLQPIPGAPLLPALTAQQPTPTAPAANASTTGANTVITGTAITLAKRRSVRSPRSRRPAKPAVSNGRTMASGHLRRTFRAERPGGNLAARLARAFRTRMPTLLIGATLIAVLAVVVLSAVTLLTRTTKRSPIRSLRPTPTTSSSSPAAVAMSAAQRIEYQPNNVRVTTLPAGVRITWTAPLAGADVSEFVVAAERGGKAAKAQAVAVTANSATLTGLPAHTRYCFVAAAVVIAKDGQSQVAAATPVCAETR